MDIVHQQKIQIINYTIGPTLQWCVANEKDDSSVIHKTRCQLGVYTRSEERSDGLTSLINQDVVQDDARRVSREHRNACSYIKLEACLKMIFLY